MKRYYLYELWTYTGMPDGSTGYEVIATEVRDTRVEQIEAFMQEMLDRAAPEPQLSLRDWLQPGAEVRLTEKAMLSDKEIMRTQI